MDQWYRIKDNYSNYEIIDKLFGTKLIRMEILKLNLGRTKTGKLPGSDLESSEYINVVETVLFQ